VTVYTKFEHVLTTSGTTILVALACSIALRQFTPVDSIAWWFGVSATLPIRGFLFGWTPVALILAARCRRSLSKPFWTICWINASLVALMVIWGLVEAKVVS